MSLLPALDGAFGDGGDSVTVDGEAVSWSRLAGRADTLAALIAGAPAVAGPVERAHIVNDSGAALIIGDPDWPESQLTRIEVPRSGEPSEWAAVAERSPGLIMYTSGTTGPPKGAVISRAAIAADLDGLAEAWGWTADDTLVHGLPLFHVHGLVLGAYQRGTA